jgi:long-chain acyl-CoA synthetase
MRGICEGRVVIVTGGGRGIGREHCLEFARQGAKVVVNDVGAELDGTGSSPDPAGHVVEMIRAMGGEAVANGNDVSDWESAKRLVQTAVNVFGRLDVLVNNAGILRDRMLVNMTPDDWDAVIRVHLRGTFAPTRVASEYWRERAKVGEAVDARIINTSSASGIYGNPGQANYGTAKAGIAAFTIIAAMELGRYGITVNAIAPGGLTRMNKDLAEIRDQLAAVQPGEFAPLAAENISPLVAWLGSAMSRGVTGRVFNVVGGHISVAEGWAEGPAADKDGRWDPAELSSVIPDLVSRAAANADTFGRRPALPSGEEVPVYPGNWSQIAGDRPAVIWGATGEVVTYQELDDRSARAAQYLRQTGLRPGDHIAILMQNSPTFLEVCWAAQRSGIYYTPMNWHLTAAETQYIIADSGARLLLCGSEQAAQAIGLTQHLDNIRLVVSGARIPGHDSYEEAVSSSSPIAAEEETEGYDMIYTSGTSGVPKGGTGPLSGTWPGADSPERTSFYRLFGLDDSSVYLSPGQPLYHAVPLRFCLGVHRLGGTAVLMGSFDPAAALEAIERYRITHSQWVPTMFVRLLRLPKEIRCRFDLASHRVAVHGAAPCPPSIKQQMLDWWGPILYEYYGASEGGGLTFIGPQDWLAHPGSVGRAKFGTIHIVGEYGEELPAGETGLVYAEGGYPVSYHNDPGKTASTRSPQGWTTVGDLGWLDDAGYLYLADRRENLIISGGVNIYPQEIENALIRHPAVADVAVIGVPNHEYGQEVKAVVELVDHREAGPDLERELIEFCRGEIARFKCPRSVDFADELPRTPSGKLYKRRLMARYWPDQPASSSPATAV